MSCQFAKRKRPGDERQYQVCLHPDVRLCKCWNEDDCPLKHPAYDEPEIIEEEHEDIQDLLDL